MRLTIPGTRPPACLDRAAAGGQLSRVHTERGPRRSLLQVNSRDDRPHNARCDWHRSCRVGTPVAVRGNSMCGVGGAASLPDYLAPRPETTLEVQ